MDLNFYVDSDGCAITLCNGVKGMLTQGDTHVLLHHVKNLTFNSKYVEVGSYLGCSSVLTGLNIPNKSLVYSHDIWVDNMKDLGVDSAPPPEVDNYFYKFYENILDNNLESVVIPIRGDSKYTLGIHKDKSIDLAFIDGDHSYKGVTDDLEMILPKMKEKGIILCHDATPESEVQKAIVDFCSKNELNDIRGFNGSLILGIYLT